MSRWITECEYYPKKNITFYFVTTCKKVEVKPPQFNIGRGQALPGHQRVVFKLPTVCWISVLDPDTLDSVDTNVSNLDQLL